MLCLDCELQPACVLPQPVLTCVACRVCHQGCCLMRWLLPRMWTLPSLLLSRCPTAALKHCFALVTMQCLPTSKATINNSVCISCLRRVHCQEFLAFWPTFHLSACCMYCQCSGWPWGLASLLTLPPSRTSQQRRLWTQIHARFPYLTSQQQLSQMHNAG